MRKILSIFMVAVLSLNLLCQPCEAMNNPQVGSVCQQNQRSNGNSQGKVGCIGKMCNFVKTAIKTVFAVAVAVVALPLALPLALTLALALPLTSVAIGFLGFGTGLVVGGGANCEYKMPDRFPSEAMSDECKKNINDFLASNECSADLMNFFEEFTKSYYEAKE